MGRQRQVKRTVPWMWAYVVGVGMGGPRCHSTVTPRSLSKDRFVSKNSGAVVTDRPRSELQILILAKRNHCVSKRSSSKIHKNHALYQYGVGTLSTTDHGQCVDYMSAIVLDVRFEHLSLYTNLIATPALLHTFLASVWFTLTF